MLVLWFFSSSVELSFRFPLAKDAALVGLSLSLHVEHICEGREIVRVAWQIGEEFV